MLILSDFLRIIDSDFSSLIDSKEIRLVRHTMKNRTDGDWKGFDNLLKFDNELLIIDTESSMTFLGFEENKEQKNRDRIREILDRKKQQTV